MSYENEKYKAMYTACQAAIAEWEYQAETYERARFSPRHPPARTLEPKWLVHAKAVVEAYEREIKP